MGGAFPECHVAQYPRGLGRRRRAARVALGQREAERASALALVPAGACLLFAFLCVLFVCAWLCVCALCLFRAYISNCRVAPRCLLSRLAFRFLSLFFFVSLLLYLSFCFRFCSFSNSFGLFCHCAGGKVEQAALVRPSADELAEREAETRRALEARIAG